MKLKQIATACVVSSLAFTAPEAVYADAGDALVGGLIGGLIGAAIANDQNKKRAAPAKTKTSTKSRTKTKSSSGTRSTATSSAREANREVQTALNYFEYPVGTPDGSIGPKSRAAISQYQLLLGYAPTGQLTEFERSLLVAGYQRGLAGGALVAQTIATHPLGVRGLLLKQRDEMAGLPAVVPGALPAVSAGATAPAPVPALPVLTAVPAAPAVPAVPAAAAPVLAGAAAPVLPSFLAGQGASVSLASHCNQVSLVTNTNGGYMTVAALTDPVFALGEQFCLARTYAMAKGDELAGSIGGFTPAQIAEQCKAFGPVLAPYVAALSIAPRDEVLGGVNSFVQASGMAPAQLAGTAKICLGVGYTTNAMDIAIGSALLLTAVGEKAYAELIGHHLGQGFGVPSRPDLALGWYDVGLEAAKAGQVVFAPGLSDRGELIHLAAYRVGGAASKQPLAATLPAPGLPAPGLPVPGLPAPALPAASLPAAEAAPAAKLPVFTMATETVISAPLAVAPATAP